MPIRNWGGGGDHSNTFLALQDEFIRRAQELIERRKAEAAAKTARRSSGGGGGGGGGSRRSSGGSSGSSSSHNEQAGVIIDGMSRGTTDWRDLYAFYKRELTRATGSKNTSRRAQITRQIHNIELIAEANGISLAGGTAPTNIAEAEPGTFRYQAKDFLSPEVDAAINDQILYLMATRNGVYPGDDRPLASYAGRMLYDGTVKELREGMIADAKMQEEILTDIKNGATQVLDPVSGLYMEVTPDFMMNVIYQYNENQLGLAGLERGLGDDFGQRIKTWEGVQDTLIAPIITTRVFPLTNEKGTVAEPDVEGIRGYMDRNMENFNVLVNTAMYSSDPNDTIKSLAAAGRFLKRNMKDMESFINTLQEGFEVEEYVLEDIKYSAGLADFLTHADSMTAEEAMTLGSELLTGHPGDNYFLSKGDVETLVGGWTDEVGSMGKEESSVAGRISPGWHGVGGAIAANDGVNAGIAARKQGAQLAIDIEAYVYVAPYGQSSPVAVPQSQAAAYLQSISGSELFDERGLSSGAVPSIEKIRMGNGRTVDTVVWREMQAPSEKQTHWWSRKNDRGEQIWATMADFEQFGGNDLLGARQGWKYTPFAGLENYLQVLGADSQTYYVHADTHQIYINQPIDLDVGAEFHFTDLIGADGKVLEAYRDVTYNGDFVLRGPGVDEKIAQTVTYNAFNSEELDINSYKWLNEFGVPLRAPTIAEIAESMEPSPDWYRGQHLTSIGEGQLNSRRFALKAQREQTRAREFQKKWLATQNPNLLDEDMFGKRFENVIENSIKAAQKQTGIRFGPNGGKRIEGFREPMWQPNIEELSESPDAPVLPPVSYDSVKPTQVAPVAGTLPKPKPTAPPAPIAQPKPAGKGGGGGAKII